MLVAGRDFSEEILARIRSRVKGDPVLTRTELSREVCRWLGWQSANGRPKDMSCRVALLKLARRGVIELPAGQAVSFAKPTEALAPALRDWLAIETKLAELGPVWLVAVDSGQPELSSTWWAMMQAHHPLGAGPLCGAQLRYLVACEGGFVGALSFSAAAWRLAPRDAWIGWDDRARQTGLSKVVANSRFLILPEMRQRDEFHGGNCAAKQRLRSLRTNASERLYRANHAKEPSAFLACAAAKSAPRESAAHPFSHGGPRRCGKASGAGAIRTATAD